MKYDILTIGGLMRDIFFLTNEGVVVDHDDPLCRKLIGFELGAKVYVNNVYFEPGGGASNTAVGFSKLGLKSAIIARIGQDREGDQLIKSLKKNKVGTKWIQVDKKESTGMAFVLALKNRKRTHVIMAHRGVNDKLDFNYNLSEFKGIPYIYVSSISAPKWPEIMDKVCFLVKGGAKLAWNPSNVQLKAGAKKLSKCLENTYILSINEDEARELVLSKNKVNGFRLKFLLKEIFEMGPKIIVITMGPKGAVAYDGKKFYHQKTAPSKVVHTTGAGDSFTAAFVASLIHKPSDIQRALKWGMINSASVINYVGAQKGLLTQKEILKRYDF